MNSLHRGNPLGTILGRQYLAAFGRGGVDHGRPAGKLAAVGTLGHRRAAA